MNQNPPELVEDQVVGSTQRAGAALGVDRLDFACGRVDPLNRPAGPGARHFAGDHQTLHIVELETTAVVADVDLAVRTVGRSVGSATTLGNDRHLTVGGNPAECAAGDLHEQHAPVSFRDRTFGKEQPRSNNSRFTHRRTVSPPISLRHWLRALPWPPWRGSTCCHRSSRTRSTVRCNCRCRIRAVRDFKMTER